MSGKRWNLLTAAGVLVCGAGVLWNSTGAGAVSKWIVLLGAALFLAGMLGSNRCHAAHPLCCPVCGHVQQPRGRFFPGLGYNGTDTLTCDHCGATLPLSAWSGGGRDAAAKTKEKEE